MVQGERIPATTPFDEVHVALDLETTGLDAARDTIIEVGAVKFPGRSGPGHLSDLYQPGPSYPRVRPAPHWHLA